MRLLRRRDRGDAGAGAQPARTVGGLLTGLAPTGIQKQHARRRSPSAALPATQDLRTRADDDFTIALLDAAAMIADVLTFYQERLVNESFLRTASERRSVLELARLIGYELHPGVAASTVLAFTLEGRSGRGADGDRHRHAECKSIPGPGEKPQTFETIEKIDARVEWNALKPQMSRVQSCRSSAPDRSISKASRPISSPATRSCSSAKNGSSRSRQRALGLSPDQPA